jgi:hypothetical protein
LRRLLLILAILVAGDLALLGTLRGRPYALVWLDRDPDGRYFSAAPDPHGVAHIGEGTLQYGIPARSKIEVPVATGGDGGLEDVRAAILWVRRELRVGDDFHAETWWLRDIVDAAARGDRGFMCDSYSRALAAVFMRMGYTGRIVHLDGHISCELYLPSRHQWVFADALYDFIAEDETGHPLSLVEAARHWQQHRPLVWHRVEGSKGDDDELSPANKTRLQEMLERADFTMYDGPFAFGRLSRLDRLHDLVTGRVRAVQLAMAGQPRDDGVERLTRMLILIWNGSVLLMAFAVARPATRTGSRAVTA